MTPLNMMPTEIIHIFERLSSELSGLHARWKIYNQLFIDQKRIDLLNESAGSLFYLIERVICDDLLLGICRLTDPAKSYGKDNLTLEQLLNIIKVELQQQILLDKLEPLLCEITAKREPFQTIRHKSLAHLDLKSHIDYDNNPLPGITLDDINQMLMLMSNFMNLIESSVCDSATGYEYTIMIGSDGDALISLLKYGLRYQQLLGTSQLDYSDAEHVPYIGA
jgi:hypothetical protein